MRRVVSVALILTLLFTACGSSGGGAEADETLGLYKLQSMSGITVASLAEMMDVDIAEAREYLMLELKDGGLKEYEIAPEQFGLKRCRKEDLVGGTPAENAVIVRRILGGEQGPQRDAVLMNAGAALYIGGKAKDLAEGIVLAGRIIDSGAAARTLERFVEISNRPE